MHVFIPVKAFFKSHEKFMTFNFFGFFRGFLGGRIQDSGARSQGLGAVARWRGRARRGLPRDGSWGARLLFFFLY